MADAEDVFHEVADGNREIDAYQLQQALNNSLTQGRRLSLHSICHSFIRPLPHSLTHSLKVYNAYQPQEILNSSLTQGLRLSLHSICHSFIHSFVHSLLHSLTEGNRCMSVAGSFQQLPHSR